MQSALIAFALWGSLLPAVQPAARDESALVRARAFDLVYNLDHEEAIALLRREIAAHPNDPALHRALASVLWLHVLFLRGAVTVDHYLGSFSRTQVELKRPPPDLDEAFRTHVARAIELAQGRLASAPRDPQAHYDLGAAIGLRASHVATVEGKMLAGFNAARRAFDEHEKVLDLDPTRKDAALIVGIYRYIVSTMSFPLRMLAYVVGFGGGRDRGINLIEEAAAYQSESRTDAMFALVLVYNREHRYDDALKVLGELRRMYPRNRLVVLEAGSTALRAGRSGQAESLLTEGLGLLAKEKRERIPGEESLWRYKRGAARVASQQPAAAVQDLRAAIGSDAPPWVAGRAHTELARLSLARGDRAEAASEAGRAESLCAQGNDPPCVDQARRLLRSTSGR
jgi:tetratricopeptide (TPR) repeat protein